MACTQGRIRLSIPRLFFHPISTMMRPSLVSRCEEKGTAVLRARHHQTAKVMRRSPQVFHQCFIQVRRVESSRVEKMININPIQTEQNRTRNGWIVEQQLQLQWLKKKRKRKPLHRAITRLQEMSRINNTSVHTNVTSGVRARVRACQSIHWPSYCCLCCAFIIQVDKKIVHNFLLST